MLNLLCTINGTTKPGKQCICLQYDILNILSPLLRPTAQEKKKKERKNSFQNILLIDNAPGHPRALIEINVFSHLEAQHPFCSPWIKE